MNPKLLELAEQLIREAGGNPADRVTVTGGGVTWVQEGKPASDCPSDGAYGLVELPPGVPAGIVLAEFVHYLRTAAEGDKGECIEIDLSVRGGLWCKYCYERPILPADERHPERLYGVRCEHCRTNYP